jgi:hypothetical protein
VGPDERSKRQEAVVPKPAGGASSRPVPFTIEVGRPPDDLGDPAAPSRQRNGRNVGTETGGV